jgi:uncharacterized phage protein (TIGR02220 family)
MSNTHLRDKSLSLKGKGLLSVMLSLPESWEYTIAGLVAISKENETAIKSTLDELKKCGYLVVTKLTPAQTESGRFEYLYDIYEQPQRKEAAEKQAEEKQGVEVLGLENQGQLNTDSFNTKKSITNKELYIAILDYLNAKAETNYKASSKATQQHINARLAEGFTLDDFKTVIDKKCAEWLGTDFEKYLRPSTLFGSKFENYLNGKQQTKGKNGIAVSSKPSDLDGVF